MGWAGSSSFQIKGWVLEPALSYAFSNLHQKCKSGDLRLPSGEHDKEEEEQNGIDNMLDTEEKLVLHNGDLESGNIVVMGNEVRAEDGGSVNSPMADNLVFKEDTNLEPLSGMEFDSHGEAYSFYQEYARSMGFNTAIQNSRRSKTSREFIDAKFACSRYGTKREYDKSYNRPRARQSKQEQDNATGELRAGSNDCRATRQLTTNAQEGMHPQDKLSSRAVTLDGYYGTQQSVQGMVQLNLMAPTRDNYYGNQQTIQGLGQLNSIAPSHDGYYSTQQGMHGLGQMDFFRTPTGFTYGIRDDPNVRTAQLHDDASRHAQGRKDVVDFTVRRKECIEAEPCVKNEMYHVCNVDERLKACIALKTLD
ncbi:hypothetical protein JRO89_XS12G0166900 [Xanthoceras sorbifolium]|uniref:FAR1 domain-containing protein n=1 Tax=Xanthoceras sorbifolium TaxID=99658 RepID=A0ABQ8HCV6_9ROSI|nr:hypothetical protein JRO89_XS12G0166900 [Xanthoceras sorbifolium]